MLTNEQKNMLLATACVAVLVAVASYSSFAGMAEAERFRTAEVSAAGQGPRVEATPNTAAATPAVPQATAGQPGSHFGLEKETFDDAVAAGTVAVLFLQLIVFGWQGWQLRRSVGFMNIQARDMKDYIAEAARSANAMEGVAKTLTDNTAITRGLIESQRTYAMLQMRAYICVLVGNAIYQERDKLTIFEAQPILMNSGNTPAHKVSYWARCDVLPVPLPADFDFPPPESASGHAAVLGPHQSLILNSTVPDFVDDAEVPRIKAGFPTALYIWGVVSYEDEFKVSHITKFCQSYKWMLIHDPNTNTTKEIVRGFFNQKHNESD